MPFCHIPVAGWFLFCGKSVIIGIVNIEQSYKRGMDMRIESEQTETEDKKMLEQYAAQVMQLARDTITVRFRFFDAALARLKCISNMNIPSVLTDGETLYYNPVFLLRKYLEEPGIAVRIYLHILFHLLFSHPYQYDRLNEACWNLAADIAVEDVILSLDIPMAALDRDEEEREALESIKLRVKKLTADKLYQDLMREPFSKDEEEKYHELFAVDAHNSWHKRVVREQKLSEEEWKKLAERMKTEMKLFSKNRTDAEKLRLNLSSAVRKKVSYRRLLEQFAVLEEEMTVSADEFDYIYYMYGLSLYGNMPLIEPLEYKENRKIKEFVIVIDTSASCKGETVFTFLRKTYEILKETESYFRAVHVRILQCDSSVRADVNITSQEELEHFISHAELSGFGSTDFRPAFQYVDQLVEKKAFTNLKGLIYFTDGYGVYPEKMPKYQVMFAFINEDETRPPVPDWAVPVILEDEGYEY